MPLPPAGEGAFGRAYGKAEIDVIIIAMERLLSGAAIVYDLQLSFRASGALSRPSPAA
jgi:hypothetical protein